MDDMEKSKEAIRKMQESLDKMRDSLDAMISSDIKIIDALPNEASATKAFLETTIPAWDSVSQNDKVKASPEWGVLIQMHSGFRSAVFDLERRVIALEMRED